KATLQSGNDPYDPQTLAAAEAELKAILRNKDLAAVHNYAQQILTFVEFRLHPEERLALLESELPQGKGRPRDIAQDLDDYLKLPPPPTDGTTKNDMAAWIMYMSSPSEMDNVQGRQGTQTIVLQRWREHRQLHWL